jgi:hypothetical protein
MLSTWLNRYPIFLSGDFYDDNVVYFAQADSLFVKWANYNILKMRGKIFSHLKTHVIVTYFLFFTNYYAAIRKVKLHSHRHVGAKEEKRYSSYSFLTSALDGDECSAARPGSVLLSGKDPQYPLDRRLGGRQTWSGHRS